MLKLGVLLCAYDCEDLLEKCLSPWFNYNDNQNRIVISVVSTQFEDFEPADNSKTLEILNKYKKEKLYPHQYKIDSIFTSNIPLKEHEARNLPLQRLLELECDAILVLDSDEVFNNFDIKGLFYTLDQEKDSENIWYRTNYRNLTFDNQHFTDDFDPARVFWVNKNNYQLQYFYYDNDVYFYYLGEMISYIDLKNRHIPRSYCFPCHFSWCDLERSKKKINYQIKHFGHGNSNYCSFKFNQEKNCIEFNDEYFALTGKKKPDIFSINDF